MTIKDCYLYVTDALNNNSTNTNQVIQKHTFVRTMRAATLLWLKDKVKRQEGNKSIQRDLIPIVETKRLIGVKRSEFYEFNIPSDYYHEITIRVNATKGKCHLTLDGVLIESSNLSNYLIGDDTRSNFEWEQTIVTLEGGVMKVWYAGFEIDNVDLVYYRKPTEVDMETGHKDVNTGIETVDVDSDFKDSALIEILNKTAFMLGGNISNSNYPALGTLQQLSQ